MKLDGRQVLVCSCENTMQIDGDALARACGADGPASVHTHLCRAGIGRFSEALKTHDRLLVCCTQEAPLFSEVAEEAGAETELAFVNIRERAGWSDQGASSTAKMAALIAEASVDVAPAGQMTLTSDGMCLVYGAGQTAFDTTQKLSKFLNVSLVLTDAANIIVPPVMEFAVHKGTISRAGGHFGGFEVLVNGYAPVMPSSRATLDFAMARDGASATCSVIVDLSGGNPLVGGGRTVDGYLRADPGDRAAVAETILAASDLVGEFEKPLYINYDPAICAHSRSRKIGCRKCVDICPASAVQPGGEDHVVFDAAICGGCGGCASVCPTGAAGYNLPSRDDLLQRLKTLVSTFLSAGGTAPVLLVHDQGHGFDVINLMARHGRGLPANVLPFAVNEVTQIGHEFLAAALAQGAAGAALLIDPRRRDETIGLAEQCRLAIQLFDGLGHADGAERLKVIDETDPDAAEAIVWTMSGLASLASHDFLSSGDKRQVARTALWLMATDAPGDDELIALEAGAPYGRINVDTDGCTLCLACVSACPMGAIRDNPDRPQVRFVEHDCVQCGLCASTCPERVITLEPRFNLSNDAMSPQLLHEEEPANCIECGKPFGSKSSIETIVEKLAGRHSMFQTADAQRLIRMCDDCRIISQANSEDNPFAMGQRPRLRTTEDYLDGKEEDDA